MVVDSQCGLSEVVRYVGTDVEDILRRLCDIEGKLKVTVHSTTPPFQHCTRLQFRTSTHRILCKRIGKVEFH